MDTHTLKQKHDLAAAGLKHNTRTVFGFDKPVLNEGGVYRGIWLECGPMEGAIYGRLAPGVDTQTAHAVAIDSHDVFFHHQREDGYLPCWVSGDKVGSHSIQMVVPIAKTAWETARLTGDEAFLARAYDACAAWDGWLARNRDTRGTGLCEAFCEFDTGHDGSPRFAGLPCACPDDDAAKCPNAGQLPYLAPDLSATLYGGRVALAAMAEHLGKAEDAKRWHDLAGRTRELIINHCYCPDDECFYDVGADGEFIRIRGDVLTRVFSERVVDQQMFDRIYQRHIKDPEAFWTPYPLPSIAANDPAFVKKLPKNSWGGATQALTALRTPRWFGHYGKADDHRHLMTQWVEAIAAAPDFMQQMNPWTGEFSTSEGYSPAMLVFVEFVGRLGLLEEDG